MKMRTVDSFEFQLCGLLAGIIPFVICSFRAKPLSLLSRPRGGFPDAPIWFLQLIDNKSLIRYGPPGPEPDMCISRKLLKIRRFQATENTPVLLSLIETDCGL
jgi:hypothetical protein